ncbi:MAG: class I SAM-dependent methyltransferase [bacterium]
MQILDPSSTYTRFEAWAYDTFTAPALNRWIETNLLDSLLEPVPDDGTVLDVGCGGGQLPLAIKDHRPDLSVTGLDLSADQIRWATDRSGGDNPDVPFLVANALQLPFPDDHFDLVVSVGSIKYWPDQPLGLNECQRLLKSSGTLRILEADPEVSWRRAWAFTGELNFPGPLRLPFMPYFKYVVAGNGLTESRAEQLISGTNPAHYRVRRLQEKPLVDIKARK